MSADVLAQFTRRPPPPGERCELCGEPLPDEHRHLVDTTRRSLKCSCPPCHLLFTRPGAGQGRFRAVPDRYLTDPGFTLGADGWNRLQIPVGLAFFFRNSALDRFAAFYPSPAGATESELDPATWDAVIGSTRLAGLLEDDVEALLLHAERGKPATCTLVPIDVCYELVGRMRLHWKGFDGGAEARADIEEFFGRVAARARPLPAETEASGAGNPGGGAP
ncbi:MULTISPECIES: DUF5947 family protein [Streptomyces]|uniref:Uncharacterized protein n=1 Tax=Streptomyces arboris TaxID=2600619 RepID=A0A5N5EQX2_9ACTN|nr:MULTISPECIES: DUF5947 family protein [Streptomyces]KAB2591092.1 hypothetical protein F5983_18180 [Streptomyces arboris]MDX3378517.1 DUF5947 family protein [Streptomyces sp. ME02-6991-2A]